MSDHSELGHVRPWRHIERRKSRQIMVGSVPVGGDAPISVQSMTNTPTSDANATIGQIRQLEEAGADIVRVSCPDEDSTAAFRTVAREARVPLVADIHFHYKRGIEAAEAGAACLRINPGNIGNASRVRDVIQAAKDHGCSMRIGVNAGSLERELLEKYGEPCPDAMVESALSHARILQDHDFHEFKISVKASDPFLTVAAYQQLAEVIDCPLHLGVTEAGPLRTGTIKSAIGMGNMLWAGIGDTIRVSLAADPVEEIKVGFDILKSLACATGASTSSPARPAPVRGSTSSRRSASWKSGWPISRRRCRCRSSAASSTDPARRSTPTSASPAAARAPAWSI